MIQNFKKVGEVVMAVAGVAGSLLGIKGFWDSLKTEIEENAIYTIKQVAKFLRVKKDVVVDLIESGQLKARKLGPSLQDYRVTGKSLLDYMNGSA